jgi:hypothetical protein
MGKLSIYIPPPRYLAKKSKLKGKGKIVPVHN